MLNGGFLNRLTAATLSLAELGEHIFNRQRTQLAQGDSADIGIDHLQLATVGSQRTGRVFALSGEPALCVVLKCGAAILTETVLEVAFQFLRLVHDVLPDAARGNGFRDLDGLGFADFLAIAVAVADGNFVLTFGELFNAGHQ